MKGLEGKVAVIAGVGGLGVPVAERLARAGAHVVAADRRPESAERAVSAAQSAGGRAIAVDADISDEKSVAALFAAAVEEFGGVDLLDLNAADLSAETLGADHDILAAPLDVFDRSIAVNLRGHVLCTRAAVPLMVERGGGSIVYISSEAGLIGSQYSQFYGASKGGLNAFMRHVAFNYGKQGVRANALSIDMTLTANTLAVVTDDVIAARLKQWRTPRLAEPDDVAAMIEFLLSEECVALQGQVIAINGGVVMR